MSDHTNKQDAESKKSMSATTEAYIYGVITGCNIILIIYNIIKFVILFR